ncbi:copper resistance protein CopC [Microbacterium sp. NPDC057407]|uniref:copper resistance CopC family protein n=1 Tax=Microbacterium sp. NPDC057407 TaxID=3346120 RepID=UPI00366BEE2C
MPLARRAGALAAALAAAFVLALLPAASAEAHDEFLGSTPAPDSTVDAVPDDLTLTFSGAIATDPGASEVAVTDASGASLIDGSPTAQDNVLTQPLRGEASGIVTVLWKVVSSDGHPISGQFSFTVTAASPSPTASPTATATPEPTPTPSASATTTATPVPAGDATVAEAWPWILAGLLVAAVGGAVLYLLASRARREKELAENRVRAPGTAPGTGSEPPAEH